MRAFGTRNATSVIVPCRVCATLREWKRNKYCEESHRGYVHRSSSVVPVELVSRPVSDQIRAQAPQAKAPERLYLSKVNHKITPGGKSTLKSDKPNPASEIWSAQYNAPLCGSTPSRYVDEVLIFEPRISPGLGARLIDTARE